MKTNAKKILAREFLILLGSTILFFLFMFLWMFIENINDNKINEIQNKITPIETVIISKINSMEEKGISEKTIAETVQKIAKEENLNKFEMELEKSKESFFNSSNEKNIVIYLLIIMISIVYVLRYLIYATKWSLKQINTTANNG